MSSAEFAAHLGARPDRATIVYTRAIGTRRPLAVGFWVQSLLALSFAGFAVALSSDSQILFTLLYLWQTNRYEEAS